MDLEDRDRRQTDSCGRRIKSARANWEKPGENRRSVLSLPDERDSLSWIDAKTSELGLEFRDGRWTKHKKALCSWM